MHENETPVSETEAKQHAALIAHLKYAVLPGAAEAAEAAEVAEAVEATADGKLPKTIAATIALIHEKQAVQPKSKTEAAVKEAGLVRLRAHLHAISQGPTAPSINYKAFLQRDVPASALAYVEASYPKTKTRKA